MNDASVIRELEKEYEQKARRARHLRDERVEALFEKHPSLAPGAEKRCWINSASGA